MTPPYTCDDLRCPRCAYVRLGILQAKTPVPIDAYLPPEMV